MKRKRTITSVFSAWLLALTISPVWAVPQGELTVVVANFGREQLDLGKTSTQDLHYTGHVYEPLIGTDLDGKLSGERGLAESWKMSDDARVYTIALHKDVRWHDGKPFTADDVLFSLGERYVAKDAICTFCRRLNQIEKIEAVDPLTVRITLKEPDPVFLAVLSGRDGDIRILPRHGYRATADGFEMIGNPVGTGPWKFVSFDRGVDMKLAANVDYWDKRRIPEFATMRLLPRAQPSTRLSAVRTGEADMAFINPLQVADAKAANLRVLTTKAANLVYMSLYGCYQAEILCHQEKFREAIFRAINVDAIFKRIYPDGTAERMASTFWTQQALGYDPALKPYAYDPKGAAKLLKDIGYDGKPVKLYSVQTGALPEAPRIAELVDGYLRAAGFKVELTPMEFGAFRPLYATRPQTWDTRYATYLNVEGAPPRPTVLPNLSVGMISQEAGGLIQAYWNLPKIDAEWAKLIKITKVEQLETELRRINNDMYNEYISLPIAARGLVVAVGPKVKGWTPSPYGYAWHLETVTRND